ncbi:TIGR00645 family protein [Oharaeibacter diazotrophicus]|uniref:UPF0114 protein EDD54_0633 n=1 Tax=Oharaeibacter diazotrophicus TaxID=1920512 RepID=A0A4R6RJZ3_9HYPH|nr:TIGR00645 family protein [Oharaeibacter diazotrophicus]TDP86752.1 uncharacterized protein (TIGR00645 family) [Oharaeibacter diazotrophicus]BBE71305.1 hypothetical protein OHA_1_00878 [Pleomorphomonas sp. SM30]GLS78060.1 UPF0114 protein [Oharaeibacter diazotrophicus]
MKSVEQLIERLLLASRWTLVVFLGGLGVALAIYAIAFVGKLWKVAVNVLVYAEDDMILAMLGLIDAALVASLIVMVMISSYENFVGRLDEHDVELSFIGKLDSGSLKIKVASSIVAISSIHLLQVFLNVEHYTDNQLLWSTVMHLAFVVSALLLGFLDKLTAKAKV